MQRSKLIAIILAVIVIAGSGAYIADVYGYHPEIKKGFELNINSNVSNIRFNSIVSLDPAATATLYAIGSINNVTGIYSYPGLYPNSNVTGDILGVTAYPSMNVEEILNISPQAVISFSDYKQSQINELLNAGIDYIFISAGSNISFNTIMKQNLFLGEITGNEKNASILNNWMEESLNNFSTKVTANNTNALYSLCVYNGKSYVAGNNTFISAMMKYAHLINIANGSGFYEPSNENITAENPHVLILGSSFNDSDLGAAPYKDTYAVTHDQNYTVVNANIFAEPNFRDIYGIQWLIYEADDHEKVQIPEFPFNLTENPEPSSVKNIESN